MQVLDDLPSCQVLYFFPTNLRELPTFRSTDRLRGHQVNVLAVVGAGEMENRLVHRDQDQAGSHGEAKQVRVLDLSGAVESREKGAAQGLPVGVDGQVVIPGMPGELTRIAVASSIEISPKRGAVALRIKTASVKAQIAHRRSGEA